MEDRGRDSGEEGGISPRLAMLSILAFWLFHGVIVTLRAAVMRFPEQGEMAIRRAVVTLVGIAISWMLYLVLRRFERRGLTARIAAAMLLSLPAAAAIAWTNFYAFSIYDPISLFEDASGAHDQATAAQIVAEVAVSRYFFLVAWALLYLALDYAHGVRRAERRAARFAQAAQAAELRSLRYQVNPHFLFNTLNSLSSLVLSGRSEAAEAMIMNLSDFYRQSLSGDPLDDVPLEEEVALQQRYLSIEAVRFPDRLRVEVDLAEDTRRLPVPGLILQPLVENAIKHGVARSRAPVTLRIAARREEDRLLVTVTDNGSGEGPVRSGSGIGLTNVRDRLEARFGRAARLEAGPRAAGGWQARLIMPAGEGRA